MRKETVENWWFEGDPLRMCLPKYARTLNTQRFSSSGIESIDIDRKIVVTCTDDYYILGKPNKEYIKFISKMNSEYLSFHVVLNKWGKENELIEDEESPSFMEELKAI